MTTIDQDRLILRRDLPDELGVCSETVRRLMKANKLPPPDVDLSLRTRGWKLSTLRAAGIGLGGQITVKPEPTPPPAPEPVTAKKKAPRQKAEVPDPVPVPHQEGQCSLYRHYDAFGRLLYIGISLSAVERLAQHKRESHWVRQIARIDITAYGSRSDARLAERRAIKRENPAHNIHHAKDRKRKSSEVKQ
jgi:hypothetical protein